MNIETTFLNMQTDYVFKLVFGSEKNKKILIRFLNALFEGQFRVTDVVFHNKEKIPSEKEGKAIVYDVYCTVPLGKRQSPFFPLSQIDNADSKEYTDHHFILEMQNVYLPPFEERMTYYLCKAVSEQGKRGWDYELQPVFTIAITDFNFPHLKPKLVRDVIFADRETAEPFTEKLHLISCSLKEVPGKWEECKTELEEMLFLIKNMDKMDTTSLAYKEGRYTEVFEATRSNTLDGKEIVLYSNSLEKLRDTQRGIEYTVNQRVKEEVEKFKKEQLAKIKAEIQAEVGAELQAEGRSEGRAEANMQTARNLLAMGMELSMIAKATGLSLEQLEQLNCIRLRDIMQGQTWRSTPF